MSQKKQLKLTLAKETLKALADRDQQHVAGGSVAAQTHEGPYTRCNVK